jgi:hypothetical protein
MNGFPIGDQGFRGRVATELWATCGDFITPAQIEALADQVVDLLVSGGDPLKIVIEAVEGVGVPEDHRPYVEALVLLLVTELARLRAER